MKYMMAPFLAPNARKGAIMYWFDLVAHVKPPECSWGEPDLSQPLLAGTLTASVTKTSVSFGAMPRPPWP
ncbi:hypothetical protein SAMN04489731_102191 [Amycolatopsis regifaucium]|nr:hypothetical protein SAMN04489731_102191 [Amycolatopsis regifaucium]